jgi:hypothetical protein
MPHLIHNERAKLIANALDRASTGCFATGVFVPTVALMLGQSTVPADLLFAGVGAWVFIDAILHYEARRVINTLRE